MSRSSHQGESADHRAGQSAHREDHAENFGKSYLGTTDNFLSVVERECKDADAGGGPYRPFTSASIQADEAA